MGPASRNQESGTRTRVLPLSSASRVYLHLLYTAKFHFQQLTNTDKAKLPNPITIIIGDEKKCRERHVLIVIMTVYDLDYEDFNRSAFYSINPVSWKPVMIINGPAESPSRDSSLLILGRLSDVRIPRGLVRSLNPRSLPIHRHCRNRLD